MLRSLMLSVILKNANTFVVLWSVYTHKYCKINKSQNSLALKVGWRYHCYLLDMKKVEQIGIGDVRKTICVKTKVDVRPFLTLVFEMVSKYGRIRELESQSRISGRECVDRNRLPYLWQVGALKLSLFRKAEGTPWLGSNGQTGMRRYCWIGLEICKNKSKKKKSKYCSVYTYIWSTWVRIVDNSS